MKLAPPPPRDWQDFEDLCRDLWAELWGDPNAQKHGRTGQKQRGVDVFGQPAVSGGAWEGVQCKRYERQLTREEIVREVAEAREFKPRLRRLIIATTTKRDTGAQEIVRHISAAEEERGSFPVSLWSWDDIADELAEHRDLLRRHYPAFAEQAPVHNLPYPSLGDLFKGRDAILAGLDADPGEATAIVQPAGVIHGLGGIGKTRLAVEYAWRAVERFPGGVFFVAAESPARLRASLAALAATDLLALPERRSDDEDEVVGAVLRRLRDQGGWLMILDNADTAEAAAAVEELLPRLDRGRVLVTSRWTSWGREVREQPLDVLDPGAAQRYLLAAAARRKHRADDAADAGGLAELLGGLPLALEQAAAYIERYRLSFSSYLDEWQAEHERVLEWYDEQRMHYPAPVAVTWQRTFDRLSPSAATILRLASHLSPDPMPAGIFLVGAQYVGTARTALREELGSRWSSPLWRAWRWFRWLFVVREDVDVKLRDILAELADLSLGTYDGRYLTVHRVVQEVVKSRIPSARRRDWLGWTLQVVKVASIGDATDVRAWGIWDPLRPHAERIVWAADAEGIAEPTAPLMNELGRMLLTKCLFATAEPLIRRALEISEVTFGPKHHKVAVCLGNLALLLLETNHLAEAEPLMRRALEIDEAAFGPEHSNVADCLSHLAELLRITNRLAEAEPLMRRALEIDEVALGPTHPDVAMCLNNLAQLLQETNRLAEAEPLLRRALEIDEAAFGPEHPTVAIELNNLAQLLAAANRLAEAEPLLRRALEISEAAFGPNHPDVAMCLSNLALLLKDTNRFEAAEPLTRRALKILETSFGDSHPKVATLRNNLAVLLQARNRLAEAEPLIRSALKIDELAFGPEHPNVAIDLASLAKLHFAYGEYVEAERLILRVIALLENSKGPNHPHVSIARSIHVDILRARDGGRKPTK